MTLRPLGLGKPAMGAVQQNNVDLQLASSLFNDN